MHGDGCGDGGGSGWGGSGWGWFFPALIVGKLISSMFDRQTVAQPWPAQQPLYAPPQPPVPPTASARPNAATATCQNCRHTVEAGYAFCPHCGAKVTPPACQYCGQQLRPEMRFCAQCGAPRK